MINRKYIANLFKPDKFLVIKDLITTDRSFEELDIRFAKMSATEFNDLGGMLFEYVEEIATRSFFRENFNRITQLFFAFAKYAMEAAYFQKELDSNQRTSLEIMAGAYQIAGEDLEKQNTNTARLKLYQDAWSQHLESCYEYGYKSNAYSELCKVKEFTYFGVSDSQGPRR